MTDTTTWTPEARKIREAERAAARRMAGEGHFQPTYIESMVERLFPAPPPEYTYGREIPRADMPSFPVCRRSDGGWHSGPSLSKIDWLSDSFVRACAAEVQLTDKECDALIGLQSQADVRWYVARVLRGEVK